MLDSSFNRVYIGLVKPEQAEEEKKKKEENKKKNKKDVLDEIKEKLDEDGDEDQVARLEVMKTNDA